jgi:hypothetical protein
MSSGRDVFEELGRGYTLLTLGEEPRTAAAFEAAASDLGVPLRVLTDTFDGPRAAYKRRHILIRPDQFIAWTDDEPPASATDVLRRVIGDRATPA